MNNLNDEQLLLSTINNKREIHTNSFKYESVFLSLIVPDSTNARFLPVVFINDKHAKLFTSRKLSKKQLVEIYDSEDHVLIGKSCIINCLKHGSSNWLKANKTAETILDLGNNILASELIQAPTIYPISSGKFQVLTGHRRFFALVYANGLDSAAQFKVYDNKPLLSKVKQFQENASREDLPQYGKLSAFISASSEINILNTARLKAGLKKLTIKETAAQLGISMGAYDNYNVLSKYESVIEAYQSGLSYPIIKVKKLVLESESEYKIKNNKKSLNITDKDNINNEIKAKLSNGKKLPSPVKSFKITPKSPTTIKRLFSSNIMELDTSIDWDSIDWGDPLVVSNAISAVIEFLDKSDEDSL